MVNEIILYYNARSKKTSNYQRIVAFCTFQWNEWMNEWILSGLNMRVLWRCEQGFLRNSAVYLPNYTTYRPYAPPSESHMWRPTDHAAVRLRVFITSNILTFIHELRKSLSRSSVLKFIVEHYDVQDASCTVSSFCLRSTRRTVFCEAEFVRRDSRYCTGIACCGSWHILCPELCKVLCYWNTKLCIWLHSVYRHVVLRQVHSLFHSLFSAEGDLLLPLSNSSTFFSKVIQ